MPTRQQEAHHIRELLVPWIQKYGQEKDIPVRGGDIVRATEAQLGPYSIIYTKPNGAAVDYMLDVWGDENRKTLSMWWKNPDDETHLAGYSTGLWYELIQMLLEAHDEDMRLN